MPNAEDTRRATGQDGCSQPIADGGLIGVNHGRIIVFVRGQEEGLRDNPSGIGGAVPPPTFSMSAILLGPRNAGAEAWMIGQRWCSDEIWERRFGLHGFFGTPALWWGRARLGPPISRNQFLNSTYGCET